MSGQHERRGSASSCSPARTASSTSCGRSSALGGEAELLWHGDRTVGGVDAVVVPGGFAHGDYLRTGAIARFSPVMDAVAEFAAAGGPVVGICNGFQVLTEAGLLPGALQKNAGLDVRVRHGGAARWRRTRSVLTTGPRPGAILRLPINHFEGNYVCDADTLARLRADDRVVVRYVDNPNGSLDDIAGICNEAGNVVGLMPHPERASDVLLGSADGVVLLESLLAAAGAVGRPGSDAESGTPRDPGLLQHVGGHAELAPRGVRDALALRVLRRRLHERALERREVDLGAHRLELVLQVDALLHELELLAGRNPRVGGVDGGEALLDRIRGAAPTAPGSVLLRARRGSS